MNIFLKFVTFKSFHIEMSFLNETAPTNMAYMLVTWDVSHLDISPLKMGLLPKPTYSLPNHPRMFVTRLVSQSGIAPYSVA